MADVHENTSFIEGNYRNEFVIVLHSAINNYPQTSLTQVKTKTKMHINTPINHIIKNRIKIHNARIPKLLL